jgi:chromobox protein 1
MDDSLSENEYYVEKVLDKKIEDGEVQYLIKWEGWSIDQSTWEPKENLENIKHLIEDFEREVLEQREKEKKRRVGRPPLKEGLKKHCEDKEKEREKQIVNSQKNFSAKTKDNITNSNNNLHKNHLQQSQERTEEKKLENDHSDLFEMNEPEEVVGVKKDKNNGILCLIKFKERPDGLQNENTYVPSTVLKERFPKVLIKFYESKIKFIDK